MLEQVYKQFTRGSQVVACELQGNREVDLMLESQFRMIFLGG